MSSLRSRGAAPLPRTQGQLQGGLQARGALDGPPSHGVDLTDVRSILVRYILCCSLYVVL